MSEEKINIFDLDIVSNITDADFCFIADLPSKKDIRDYAVIIENMLERNLPLVCSNPDFQVLNGDSLDMCGGTIAELYQDIGGTVFRYGKPYNPIYEEIIEKWKIQSSRTLCIGDSLHHDIKGANSFKFHSIFISSGIHFNEKNRLTGMEVFQNNQPTYTLDCL